jgi:hypothetical protein
VTRSLIFSRLLAIFLIAGLITAPLSAVAAMGAMKASMSMQGDMPCCPENSSAPEKSSPEKSSPVDCDKCVLMAACMTKTFVAHPADVLAPLFASKIRTLIPASDPETDGLGYSPPPRPPRYQVLSA